MNNKIYQTIISEITAKHNIKDFFTNNFKIQDNSNVFFIFKNLYDDNGFITKSVFDITDEVIKNGFFYINTIVCPQRNLANEINDNILYILWFVKDLDKMFFDKDSIREKHIWKDVEWGKRKKNYNDKGKDPGNFWLPTNDDGKGNITSHNILSYTDIIKRCINSTTKINDDILIITSEKLKIENLNQRNNIDLKIISKSKIISNNKCITNSISNSSKRKSKIIFKSSENMIDLENGSIDLMITSPPYWDLKNYFKEGQIGQESYEIYLDRMNLVWSETYRVLKETGSMWININTRIKQKRPIFIPQDIIKQSIKLGFKLKNIVIWHKSSGIPTNKNNLVDRYEYFLWFVKSDQYVNNKLTEIDNNDYKNEDLKNGLSWNINRKAGSVAKNLVHPAIYPIKLIERIIKVSSNEGDIILDPFLGSGTTMIASILNKRNCIGYEFNEDFESLIKHCFITNKIDYEEILKINSNFVDENFIYRDK